MCGSVEGVACSGASPSTLRTEDGRTAFRRAPRGCQPAMVAPRLADGHPYNDASVSRVTPRRSSWPAAPARGCAEAGTGAPASRPGGGGRPRRQGHDAARRRREAARRPLLDYVLSGLADAGYTSVCLVIAPDHAAMRDTTRTRRRRGACRSTSPNRPEPRGTADALVAAADVRRRRPRRSSSTATTTIRSPALAALRELDGPGTVLFRRDALVSPGNIPPERVRAFAIGTVDAGGFLARLIEKPTRDELARSGPGALVSMNCWRLPPEFVGGLPLGHAVLARRAGADPGRQPTPSTSSACGSGCSISDDGVLDLSRRDDVARRGRTPGTRFDPQP